MKKILTMVAFAMLITIFLCSCENNKISTYNPTEKITMEETQIQTEPIAQISSQIEATDSATEMPKKTEKEKLEMIGKNEKFMVEELRKAGTQISATEIKNIAKVLEDLDVKELKSLTYIEGEHNICAMVVKDTTNSVYQLGLDFRGLSTVRKDDIIIYAPYAYKKPLPTDENNN
ncbi:hypothetical protein AGMMS50284_6760 [Clostridia bacterium]|nr:hypothetical protein AGMMS50284_6760 [Clostridia bacterium]